MAEEANQEWRGKVGRLSQDDLEAFLASNILCRLGVLDDDGWPYVVPVWFQYKDDGFYIIPRERSDWARYMENDNRVYLDIDEPGSLRKVLVKGEAELIERPNVGGQWVEIANEMSYRYLGPHGPDYLVPTLSEPRWLFFVKPVSIKTWQGVDWAKRYKHEGWGVSLTDTSISPIAVEIDCLDGGAVTGVAWLPGETGLLFLHAPGDPSASDVWGHWPDRFFHLGYAVLAIDLADPAFTTGDQSVRGKQVVRAAVAWLRSKGPARMFIVAAGDSAKLLDSELADAIVIVAPEVATLDPSLLSTLPKLIVAGSADADRFDPIQKIARQCRGWTLLSSFVAENSVPDLLGGRHSQQVGTQIAGFLQEFRVQATRPVSNTAKRTTR